jgi:hypothetical protein
MREVFLNAFRQIPGKNFDLVLKLKDGHSFFVLTHLVVRGAFVPDLSMVSTTSQIKEG